jgi:hypothetical protein
MSGESSLTGGIYASDVYAQNTGALAGRITSNGALYAYNAHLVADGLIIEGLLSSMHTQFAGGVVSIEGSHSMIDWFGISSFEGGLRYGRTSRVEWYVSGEPAYGYVDGTTLEERGNVFGAIDVGGLGLTIEEGSVLSVHFNGTNDSAFWLDAHAFKIAGLYADSSITGLFNLESDVSTITGNWEQQVLAGDGLYLMWTPSPIAVPEPSTYGLCVGILALAIGCRRRAGASGKREDL